MEEKIQKMIHSAITTNNYQYPLLFLSFLFGIIVNHITVSLPYFERFPEIEYKDEVANKMIIANFNSSMCEWVENSYNITNKIKNSWIAQYHIECDSLLIGLIGSSAFAGYFLGALMYQYFTTWIGRKRTLLVSCIAYCAILFIISGMISAYPVICLVFFCNISSMLISSATLGLTLEITSLKNKKVFTGILGSTISFCALCNVSFFMSLNSWRWIVILNAVAAVTVSIPFFFFSWKAQKKIEENMINNTSRMGESKESHPENEEKEKDFFNDTIESHELTYEQVEINTCEKDSECTNDTQKKGKNYSLPLINNRFLLYKVIISCILWISSNGIYSGLVTSLKTLPGDIFINGFILYSVELLSFLITGYVMNINSLGRKYSLKMYYLISLCASICLKFFVINNVIKIIFIAIFRFAIAGSCTILYTYSLEMLPTYSRSVGFSLYILSAMTGGMIFPILIEILCESTLCYVYASLSLLSLFLMFFLHETLGRPLIEAILEQKRVDCK